MDEDADFNQEGDPGWVVNEEEASDTSIIERELLSQ